MKHCSHICGEMLEMIGNFPCDRLVPQVGDLDDFRIDVYCPIVRRVISQLQVKVIHRTKNATTTGCTPAVKTCILDARNITLLEHSCIDAIKREMQKIRRGHCQSCALKRQQDLPLQLMQHRRRIKQCDAPPLPACLSHAKGGAIPQERSQCRIVAWSVF